MISGFLDFTAESLGYRNKTDNDLLIDVPLRFGGILYRCTCVNFLGKLYCVMPFRKVTKELADSMAKKIELADCFICPVNTILVQILDRHNIIFEYCNSKKVQNEELDIRELACVSAGAMCMMGYIEKHVYVENNDLIFNVVIDDTGWVRC